MTTPTTEAGRALSTNLAYDADPEQYLPGDYIARYRDAIIVIEQEAVAAALADHTPWARAVFAEQRLWMACYCGWNAMGGDEGTYNDHVLAIIREVREG